MRKRTWAGINVVAGGTLLVVLATAANAVDTSTICAQLGRAANFSVVAHNSVKTKVVVAKGSTTGNGPVFHGSVCAPKVTAARTAVVAEGTSAGDIVTTAKKGTAVSYAKFGKVTAPAANSVAGSIITGGGLVKGIEQPAGESLGGTIDTTGLSASVADCAQALTDAQNASTYFAGLTPTDHLDTFFVTPATTLTLNVTPGEVLDVDYIQLQGPKYVPNMDCASTPGATLDIVGGGPAVVNLKMLHPGVCTSVNADPTGGPTIINIMGPGKAITVHQGHRGVGFLAPLRTLNVDGTGDATDTQLGHAYAATVTVQGHADVGAMVCG